MSDSPLSISRILNGAILALASSGEDPASTRAALNWLVQQKDSLRRWADQREEEIESQAARLVAREQDLDSREADVADHSRRWQTERLGYRQEIERLRARMGQSEPVGAAP